MNGKLFEMLIEIKTNFELQKIWMDMAFDELETKADKIEPYILFYYRPGFEKQIKICLEICDFLEEKIKNKDAKRMKYWKRLFPLLEDSFQSLQRMQEAIVKSTTV